jgi:hypothetical protein
MLLVGESPPASGRFFYQADSGLYRAVRQAFVAAFPGFAEGDFLAAFRDRGCYLVDLCAEPLDRLAAAERRRAHVAAEPALRRAIEELRPNAIVTVMKSIEPSVHRAMATAGWSGERWTLPYPGRWRTHRDIFVATLAPELPRLLNSEAALR